MAGAPKPKKRSLRKNLEGFMIFTAVCERNGKADASDVLPYVTKQFKLIEE